LAAERIKPKVQRKKLSSESPREERLRLRNQTQPQLQKKEVRLPPLAEDIQMPLAPPQATTTLKPTAKYQLKVPIKEGIKTEDILGQLLETKVLLTTAQILALSPEMHQLFLKQVSTKRHEKEISVAATEPEPETTCLATMITVEGEPVKALLDTGAAVSAISYTLMKRLGFQISCPAKFKIRGIGGEKLIPLGIIHQFPVTFGKVTVPVTVTVIDAPAYEVILGTNFFHSTNANISFDEDYPTITVKWLGRQCTMATEYQDLPSLYTTMEEELEEGSEEEEEGMFTLAP